jgi:hypothetical protein
MQTKWLVAGTTAGLTLISLALTRRPHISRMVSPVTINS